MKVICTGSIFSYPFFLFFSHTQTHAQPHTYIQHTHTYTHARIHIEVDIPSCLSSVVPFTQILTSGESFFPPTQPHQRPSISHHTSSILHCLQDHTYRTLESLWLYSQSVTPYLHELYILHGKNRRCSSVDNI